MPATDDIIANIERFIDETQSKKNVAEHYALAEKGLTLRSI